MHMTPLRRRTPRPPPSHARRRAALLFVAGALAFAAPAFGQPRTQPNGLSWGELAMLPEYCRDANGIVWGDRYFNRSPNADRWEALMGADFWHIHHYCYALNNLRRARMTPDAQKRKYLLEKVRADYFYVTKNSRPDMILMPEILTRIGDVGRMLGTVTDAMEAYESAIARKPDYWPAYLNAAEMFIDARLLPRALEILRRGIAAAPASPELRKRYASAGGDPALLPPPGSPVPESAASAASAVAAATASSAASAAAAEPVAAQAISEAASAPAAASAASSP